MSRESRVCEYGNGEEDVALHYLRYIGFTTWHRPIFSSHNPVVSCQLEQPALASKIQQHAKTRDFILRPITNEEYALYLVTSFTLTRCHG